ncbi:MAG: InlB B-repeat-containing protein, partial [Firmicutes bacterium]|nr:InlB B-repeat-containing protein [Bacillota bacterium]
NYKTAGVYHEQKNRNAKLTVVASVIQNNFAFFTESGEQGWYENNIGSDNFVEFNCSPAFNIGANGTELEVYASGNELFASYEEKELVDAYSAFPVFVPALAVAAGRSYAPLSEAAAGLELELLRAYVETLGGSGLFGIDAPGRKDQLGNPRYTKIDGTSYIDPGAVQRQPARQIYTVTFDLSGAEGTEPASVTNYEGEVVDLPDMTELAPTHYTFGGWSETSGGGAIEGTYLMPDGGTTLYAIWVEDTKYTVTFDLSGAEGVAPQSVTDYAGETVQLSDGTGFTREHYTFGGWSETTGGAVIVGTYYMPEGGVVLYAVWIEDKGGDGPGGEEPGENVPGGDEGDDKPGENESGGDESGCGGSGAAANAVLFLGAALLALKKRYK